MPVITKIAVQKKEAGRYHLYFDDEYAFSVDEDILIRFALKKGMELSNQEIFEIKYAEQVAKAYKDAIQFLAFRMRAIEEVRTHLQNKDWDENIIQLVIQKLIEQKYLDDQEFAIAYINTYKHSGKKGPERLRNELQQKGIDENVIETALENYNKNEQLEHAVQLGEKYVTKHRQVAQKLLKQRLTHYLRTRGFPLSIVNQAVKEIEIEKDEEEEWQALKIQGDKAHRRYHHLEEYEYKQKMKQFLYRKGFPFSLIERYLEKKMGERNKDE